MDQELVINGNATTSGGQFKRVSVNGRGVIEGAVECDSFDCNGWGVFRGQVTAESVVVNGFSELNEDLEAKRITVNGKARIGGDVTGEVVEISGDGKIAGTLKSEEVVIKGRMSIGGDCETETFRGGGQFHIDGLLNAESIEIDLNGKSQVSEIGGKSVVIRHDKYGWMKILQTLFPIKLSVKTIEGDEIELEHTSAKVVRGKNVRIGKGCEIDLVEYSGSLEQDESAKVKEARKI